MISLALIVNYSITSTECVNYVRPADKTVTMFFKDSVNLCNVTIAQRLSLNGLC